MFRWFLLCVARRKMFHDESALAREPVAIHRQMIARVAETRRRRRVHLDKDTVLETVAALIGERVGLRCSSGWRDGFCRVSGLL